MDNIELLFFDTFSHDISEELNLDLVQFPKPVYISEVRIIPLGARVQADFPGGVRLGATNPSQFEIEFFVNDLSKPGASTFESLGGLEYKQNIHIQLECERKQIPTDGLVLRGWYTTITLAVYGSLTKSISNPQEVPSAPPTATVTVGTPEENSVKEPTIQPKEPEAEWFYENQTQNNSTESAAVATPPPPAPVVIPPEPKKAPVEPPQKPESWKEEETLHKKRPISPPSESLISLSPESISAEEEDGDHEAKESGAVEPYEPILSDEEMIDDIPSAIDYEAESQALDILLLHPPNLLDIEKIPLTFIEEQKLDNRAIDKLRETIVSLSKSVGNFISASGQEKETFVHNCETLCLTLNSFTLTTEDFQNLTDICSAGLDIELARSQPQPAYKVRHIKVGVRLTESLCRLTEGPNILLKINVPHKLLTLCMRENVALSVKLSAIRALDAALISPKIVEQFLKIDNDLYKLSLMMLDEAKLVRLKYALSSLLRKIHVYELLSELKELNENIKKEDNDQKSETKISENNKTEIIIIELKNSYEYAPTLMSQPKRQLPASAQMEFEREQNRNPRKHLIIYYAHHQLLERLLIFLCSSDSNQELIRVTREFLLCMSESKEGLIYMLKEPKVAQSLLKIFKYNQNGIGEELAWRFQVVQCLMNMTCRKNDDWNSLRKLHSLLTFPQGLQAIIHIIPMDNFIDILIPFLSDEHLYEFASEIISAVIRYSERVEIIHHRAKELIEKTRNPVLRDVMPYLSIAAQASSWNYGDVSSLISIIRKNSEKAASLPGDLITALRILHYLVFPSSNDVDPMEPYIELKHRNALTQLFAADGLSALVSVMSNIADFYEQPFLHRATLTGKRCLGLISLLMPTVKLTRALLERLVKCMGTDFKDLTAVVPLLGVYSLIEAIPSTQTIRNLSSEIVATLLIFTRAVDSDGSGNVAKSLWTQMLGEVLKMLSLSPSNFIPGLKLLTRLLPSILTAKETSSDDKPRILGFRKLWSAHLQAQANNLIDTLRLLCSSWNQELLILVSKVCKQLSDLAAPTALLVGRCLLDGILTANPLENNLPILGLLANLSQHAPMKATLLTLMNPASRAQVKSDQKYPPVIEMMCSSLKNATDNRVQLEILKIFETLCDSTINFVEEDTKESFENVLTHSVPSKEPLLVILAPLIEILASASKYHLNIVKSALNILISLTNHNYGLYHVKSCLENNPEALRSLLEYIATKSEIQTEIQTDETEEKEENTKIKEEKEEQESDKEKLEKESEKLKETEKNNENEQCEKEEINSLSELTVNFLENLINSKSTKRTLCLRVQQLSSLVTWDNKNNGHPLEKIRGTKELIDGLKSLDEKDDKEPLPEMLEPLLPAPEALLNQFSQRSIGINDFNEKSKKIPVIETITGQNEITIDLLALAAEFLPADFNLLTETQRLCAKAPPDDATHLKSQADETRENQNKQNNTPIPKIKQPFVSHMRGRTQFANSMRGNPVGSGAGRGVDPFRSRPPNTSRPPSLHVDDFVALETCGAQPTGPTGYNKLSIRGTGSQRGVMSGSRGRPWVPEPRPYLR